MAAFPNIAVRNVAGFNIPQFDDVELTYVGTTNNLDTVTYKVSGVTVAVLEFSYVGGTPSVDSVPISRVQRTL
jgi:hypothetical protein